MIYITRAYIIYGAQYILRLMEFRYSAFLD